MLILLLIASIAPQSHQKIRWTAFEPKMVILITNHGEEVLSIYERGPELLISGRQETVTWVLEQWQERLWPGFRNDPEWNEHYKENFDNYSRTNGVIMYNSIYNRNALKHFVRETL